jgi:hypothetical protein
MVIKYLNTRNNSELCIPRKPSSSVSLLTADIAGISLKDIDNFNEIRNNLAEIICYWNVNMKYKNNNCDLKLEGNCQHFIDSILKKLGIRLDFKGTCLGNYLERIRDKGTASKLFIK